MSKFPVTSIDLIPVPVVLIPLHDNYTLHAIGSASLQ